MRSRIVTAATVVEVGRWFALVLGWGRSKPEKPSLLSAVKKNGPSIFFLVYLFPNLLHRPIHDLEESVELFPVSATLAIFLGIDC